MNLPVYKVQQRPSLSSLLKKEIDPELSRECGRLRGGVGGVRSVLMGTLVAAILAGGAVTVTPVAAESNTGNGSITIGDPAYTSAAKPGRYVVTFLTAASNAGTFKVEGPDGKTVGTGAVGSLFGKHVRFTIADGDADFIVGDQFFLDVAVASGEHGGKIVAWDPTANDGSQTVRGICLADVEAPEDIDVDILYLRRLGLVNGAAIAWPDDVTDEQKAAAISTLESNHIVVRF